MELSNKEFNIIQDSINEAVKKCIKSRYAIEENIKNRIRSIVAEEYDKLSEQFSQLTEDDGKSDNMKRKAVMNILKDPKFNHAQLAYDLYHPQDQSEKDTVRSLFSKKATGKPDNDGAVRSFSDDEINKLYQMLRKK